MDITFLPRLRLAVMLAGVLAAGCGAGPDEAPEVQERLAGTWLREYAEDGVKVRRVLVLEPTGHFREMSRIAGRDASPVEHTHAGDWVFDGTNLKRRYTSMDGKLPAAPAVPFATFEIRFVSRNEFIGIDRVHQREVEYHRAAEGTLP